MSVVISTLTGKLRNNYHSGNIRSPFTKYCTKNQQFCLSRSGLNISFNRLGITVHLKNGKSQCVTRVTRRVPLVKELLTLPEHLHSPPVYNGVRVTQSLALCVCFVDCCLSFFFWPFCCLSFFDLRIFITTLVSSNSSFTRTTLTLCNGMVNHAIYLSNLPQRPLSGTYDRKTCLKCHRHTVLCEPAMPE